MKKSVLSVILFLSSLFVVGQEAEVLYKEKYSKLDFVYQRAEIGKMHLVSGNYDGSTYPSMSFNNDRYGQFGVQYNFAQVGKFNFKTGIIFKKYAPTFNLHVNSEDVGVEHWESPSKYPIVEEFIIDIPLKAEFYLPIFDKLNVMLGLGANLGVFTGDYKENARLLSVSVNDGAGNSKEIFELYPYHVPTFNVAIEASIGVQYKANFGLITLSMFRNNSLMDYMQGHYVFKNLNNVTDKEGTFYVTSNHYGLSLSVSPKKGWVGSIFGKKSM
ncbi:MAG: hypothetical protein Q4B43_06600 [Bacteroidota bacterium]|nr:hypothetical protein [Bacteroidota bacterium]